MRTAEEILCDSYLKQVGCENNKYVKDEFYNQMKTGFHDYAITAINEARKEAIEAAAGVTKGASMMGESEIRDAIISLKNDLK